MLIDGIEFTQQATFKRLTLDSLPTFPIDPIVGRQFYLTEVIGDFEPGQYTYTSGGWSAGSGGNPYSDAKESVRVATTQNVILLNGLQTLDGISLSDKDRVLVKNQTDLKANGIYQVAASGNWTRAKDSSNIKGLNAGMYTFVTEGQANAGTGWVLVTPDPITLDASDLVFTQFSGTGNISAGTGLQRVGNSFALVPTGISPSIYRSVAIDQFGRVTGGSNPTSLSEYGISDGQQTLTGAATSIATSNLLASRVVTSDASGKITQSAVGVSDLVTMKTNSDSMKGLLDAKQATVVGAASTVLTANLKASSAVASDASGKIVSSDASLLDLNNIAGTTSNIQDQLTSKLSTAGGATTGPITRDATPVSPKELVNKQYVDQLVSSLSAQPRSIFSTVPGTVTPFAGNLRWYPPFPIIVTTVRVFQGNVPGITDTVVDVLKNGVSVFLTNRPTIVSGAHKSLTVTASASLTIDDYLTVSVLQGSGEDLSIRIDYTTA